MSNRTFLQSLIRLILLFVGFNIIGSIVTLILLKSLFNVDAMEVISLLNSENPDSSAVNALKFMQFIQVFFSFIIPAHLFARSQSNNQVVDYFALHKTKPVNFIVGILLVFSVSPLVSYLSILNEQITFPTYLSSLESFFRTQQVEAEKYATLFLSYNTGKDLIINLFVVAVLAAISEELFFRGVLQRLLMERIKNIHIAIFICSLLFSALHQEFFALIPRTLLGMLLGYAYVYSRSLWVPITMHFVNNAASVILDSLFKQGLSSFDPSKDEYFGVLGLIFSFITTFALFWYWKKSYNKEVII